MKRSVVTTFRPHSEGLAKLFGPLEADIIELVWQHGRASVRDIFEALRDQGQRLSYGAVKTVLERLAKKQVLERELEDGQYIYQAPLTREEFVHSAVHEILDSLVTSFGEPVYAQFLKQLKTADPDQIEELSRLINAAEDRQRRTE